MDVICKKNPAGFLLISSLVVLTTMILIVSFYLNAIIQEIKITHITSESPQAYYLAETGVQEAIWKLQNDAVWKNNFETDPTWSATLTRNNVWGEGGSYTVTVANTTLASATITATSSIPVANSTTQRVVETNVFKAINPLPTDNIALFANNDVSSIGSEVNIIAGDLLGNKNVTFSFFSDWSVSGETKAVEDVAVGLGSHLATAAIHDSGLPPVPNKI
ncbi:MAG: hypothetical protein Q8L21_03525, partial [Candidatus Komeilibacteria bacterium]|nr:hypothetical protein [Candidatus Komeilibacteria bacterium]